MTKNQKLHSAKKAKNDEFYTRFYDIECEMNAYVEYNKNVFRDKTILLPCDDPEWSNFTRYFAANFMRFGLKKLISTSYAKGAANKETTLFELSSPLYDKDKHDNHGKLFTVTNDTNGDGIIDTDDIVFCGYLEGDGDFRSEEVTKLRDEADVIISNPPFSLFREFLDWILEGGKDFTILGNKNAISYKEVFPLFQENKIWLGYRKLGDGIFFETSKEQSQDLLENAIEGSDYKLDEGVVLKSAPACWFTNIEHFSHHDKVIFDTAANNLQFNKSLRKKLEKDYGKVEYPHYDNYDAIEVPFVSGIPCDYEPAASIPIDLLDNLDADRLVFVEPYFEEPSEPAFNCKTGKGKLYVRKREETAEILALGQPKDEFIQALVAMGLPEDKIAWINGVMGVPITFMDKYNPDQFEIVSFRKGDDGESLVFNAEREREFNNYITSLSNIDSWDDKERRRKDRWENYLRENNNQKEVQPIDLFCPLESTRGKGLVNGWINGKETYRRILVRKKR